MLLRMTGNKHVREALIKSDLSFPRRREPRKIKAPDPRFRGDDELISASLESKGLFSFWRVAMLLPERDGRWLQRLNNYSQALQRLSEAVELAGQRALTPLEQQGLIQTFEFTHELASNVMKDFFYWQGNADIAGSRDATREAFGKGLLEDGEGWMAMIKSRNQSSHTYNQAIAEAIVGAVIGQYHGLLVAIEQRMQKIGAN